MRWIVRIASGQRIGAVPSGDPVFVHNQIQRLVIAKEIQQGN